MIDGPKGKTSVGKTDAYKLLNAIINREMECPPNMLRSDARVHECPHCHSLQTIKRGHDSSGKQRYQCKACNHSFSSSTGRPFSSTNVARDVWLQFAECHLSKKSLRETARICNVSLPTAVFMKKRLAITVSQYASQIKQHMKTIEQADATR